MLTTISQMFEPEPGDEPPAGDGEIIGGEPLTLIPEGEQTGGAVAGDLKGNDISATASEQDTSDVDESAAGNGGNAGNA